MNFAIFYLIAPVATILITALIQWINNISHPPYTSNYKAGDGVITVSIYGRGRGFGSYTPYKFIASNGEWKYVINKEELGTWMLMYLILVGSAVFMFFVEEEVSLLYMLRIIIIMTEMTGCLVAFFPTYAYLYMKKHIKNL